MPIVLLQRYGGQNCMVKVNDAILSLRAGQMNIHCPLNFSGLVVKLEWHANKLETTAVECENVLHLLTKSISFCQCLL